MKIPSILIKIVLSTARRAFRVTRSNVFPQISFTLLPLLYLTHFLHRWWNHPSLFLRCLLVSTWLYIYPMRAEFTHATLPRCRSINWIRANFRVHSISAAGKRNHFIPKRGWDKTISRSGVKVGGCGRNVFSTGAARCYWPC